MSIISIFCVLLSIVVVIESIPIESGISNLTVDVDHLTENWQLVPDGNYNFHLVDINHVENDDLEPKFNPANDVVFRLFTRRNSASPQVIRLNDASDLRNSNFNSRHQTRIIIHGWNNDGESPLNGAIAQAYIQRGEFNVFTVDWGRGANTINYITARNRVGPVADILTQFIRFHGISVGSISIIGHSLGAHIAGLTGKQFTGTRIPTIIGMDTALPLFSSAQPDERLHSNDAAYVESIHTDIGLLGFSEPIGQAAFYPNWGSSQPGCGLDLIGACAHSRSWEYFAESITNNNFWAVRCRNYTDIRNMQCVPTGAQRQMGGEPANRNIDGVYYLRTNDESPFAVGKIMLD